MEQIQTHWKALPMESSMSQADFLHQVIEEAEAIVIGIGAGMSAATGFTYVGKRFTDAFPDFIAKYRFFDMLQASVFDFEDAREYWAFKSRFSLLNFFDQPIGQAYVDLRQMMSDKNYHIITTNADNAFYAAEFDMDKVFRIQGEYGLWQCSEHCHQQTYHDEALIRQMVREQSDMKIPANLVPYCPKCGAVMEVNKRDEVKGMVEDDHFHEQKARYEQFLEENQAKKILFLEIGVGHTTPQFIKHPFQQMTKGNPKSLFVTMNQKDYFTPQEILTQTVRIDDDIASVLHSVAPE
ncbi:NAD-dependent SIR2 family protein deacetylase [Virgibacillus natechei]|uniref:NAD-dependent SIR2 family protein deacetylase n=1 Tax=Virgibacillus natechei TaxID=1216297 RepID=A0ABS4IHM9_9BACI|nr:deacetylase SIR2 [Virgibacillus natechei]MBP1969956.1 NAD-dependent SIR2 family protein deacetylase [Virgibacillus natechei]UZD13384.1 deacetylase SIR2 [Virgibacillus natechei]